MERPEPTPTWATARRRARRWRRGARGSGPTVTSRVEELPRGANARESGATVRRSTAAIASSPQLRRPRAPPRPAPPLTRTGAADGDKSRHHRLGRTPYADLKLNNGVQMPALGLGVFQTPPEETRAAVEAALEAGCVSTRSGRDGFVQRGELPRPDGCQVVGLVGADLGLCERVVVASRQPI